MRSIERLCGETIFLVIGIIPKPLSFWFLFEFVLNIGLGCFVFCVLCLFVFPKKVKMQGFVDLGRCKIQDHI